MRDSKYRRVLLHSLNISEYVTIFVFTIIVLILKSRKLMRIEIVGVWTRVPHSRNRISEGSEQVWEKQNILHIYYDRPISNGISNAFLFWPTCGHAAIILPLPLIWISGSCCFDIIPESLTLQSENNQNIFLELSKALGSRGFLVELTSKPCLRFQVHPSESFTWFPRRI